MESVASPLPASAPQPNGARLMRVLAFTLVVGMMSATIFNIVLPEIRAEFHLTFAQVSWVSSAYLLIYSVGTVFYGKLADRYRLKHLMTFGHALFAAGSLIGLAAQTYGAVLLGRMLQAAGAAVIPTASVLLPVRYFPPEKRGSAMGIAMTGLAIGSALGPVVAALVAGSLHWRWLFCIPLLSLFTIPYYRKYMTDEPGTCGRIDWPGGFLMAGAVAALLLAITNQSLLSAAASLILLVLFLIRIRTARDPFVRPDLFRNRSYSLGLAIAFLATATGYSLPFLVPQLLSEVHRLGPGPVGLSIVPAAAVSALLGKRGGKLADTKGNSFLFAVASSLLLASFLLMSSFAGVSPILVAVFLIFGNVGQSFLLIALSNTVSRTIPMEHSGVGMGLMSMLNFMAGAVSAGLYSKVVDHGSSIRWNPLNDRPEAYVFGNLYLMLVAATLLIAAIFFARFGRPVRKLS